MWRLLNIALLKCTCFLAIGIIFGYYLNNTSYSLILALIATLSLILYRLYSRSERCFRICSEFLIACIFILFGFLNIQFRHHDRNLAWQYYENPESKDLTIRVTKILRETNFSFRYTGVILAVDCQKEYIPVLIRIPKDSIFSKSLEPGDELVTSIPIKSIPPPLNPYAFNYRKYMASEHIFFQVSIDPALLKVRTPSDKSPAILAYKFRKNIQSQFERNNLKEKNIALLCAILLGQRQYLDHTTYKQFTDSGAAHFLAVSGLHIGILLSVFSFLLKPLNYIQKGRTLRFLLLITFLLLYAFITGLSPSVLRAILMYGLLTYALLLQRKNPPINTLILSAFILLLAEPIELFSVGFQLSYLAVGGILLFFPLLNKLWTGQHFIFKYFWQLCMISIAAQIMVTPLILYYFHQFPFHFLLTSMIVTPLLALILTYTVILLATSCLLELPRFLYAFLDNLLSVIDLITRIGASSESLIIKNIQLSLPSLLILYFIISTTLYWITQRRTSLMLLPVSGLLLLMVQFLFHPFAPKTKDHLLVLHKTAQSMIIGINKSHLILEHDDERNETIIMDLYNGLQLDSIVVSKDNIKSMQQRSGLVIIDSTFQTISYRKDSVSILLRNSTGVHLERLLDSTPVRKVIADGSNYLSYIRRWRVTCFKRKIPFHYTGEKGSFRIYFE
ncbi:ComEC/Rec2 family competence protein [Robertkochia solimangrovi]|uniref:ComEC/Rec2 family competence protein n=1 Tax=Robertkochia solimangrovi TaxID=2213046 RepID=UPI00117DB522|nr:ComEC/Rec2 family competence protein [Robertkochia solimangrovi]TRZ43246.1 hypothetical protein DMZ48_11195 [Robertkochia solimangrovi]